MNKLEYDREYRRRIYAERRSRGVCVRCQTPAKAWYCETCQTKVTKIVVRCQKNAKVEGYQKKVPMTQEEVLQLHRNLRSRNIALGLCGSCGKRPISPVSVHQCSTCLERARQRQAARKAK